MRVNLVHVARNANQIQLPIGMGVLLNALRLNGIEARLIDLIPVEVSCRETHFKEQLSESPGIYGFSITLGNHHVNEVEKYAKLVMQANPANIVVFGGPLPSALPELMLEKCSCRFVFSGEAELAFPAWVQQVLSGSPYPDPTLIPGLHYRKDGLNKGSRHKKLKQLGNASQPDYRLFDMPFYMDYLKETNQAYPIMATRGCHRHCIFCYKMLGHGTVARDIDSVLDEIEEIIDRFHHRRFYFIDDDFLALNDYYHKFFKRKKERGLEFKFIAQTRIDEVDEETLTLGMEHGLLFLSVGVETVSQKNLDKIRKGLNIERAKRNIRMVQSLGIGLNVNLIIGFEWETEQDYENMYNFIVENNLRKMAKLSFLTPMPGTNVYRDARKKGLIPDEWDYISTIGDLGWELKLNMTRMPDSVLEYWYRRLYDLGRRDYPIPQTRKYATKLADHFYKRVPENSRISTYSDELISWERTPC